VSDNGKVHTNRGALVMTEEDGRVRVVITGAQSEIEGGLFPIKRTLGEKVVVGTNIFTDGPLGLDHQVFYQVHDLLGDARYLWSGSRNYLELNPLRMPASIFQIRRRVRTEQDFDYFM
jgi:Domain of unknown function (DUF3416)